MFLLDKFENKYFVKGTLVAESPLHIGAGSDDFRPTAVDAAVIRDENNNPYIPGTSLKGILRSNIERIIATGAIDTESYKYKACNILMQDEKKSEEKDESTENYLSHTCVDNKALKYIKEKYKGDSQRIAEEIYKNQCDVCKLFGGHGFASRIQIGDAKAILKDGEKVHTQIRDGVAIDRDTLTQRNGAKYTYEQVGAGTKFNFYMTVENLEDEHKVLLGLIVNLVEKGELKVGGKTSAGLGIIKLVDRKIEMIEGKDGLKKYYLNNETKAVVKEDLFNV